MDVVIIKYNAGNIYSVDYGLKRLGITPIITDNKERIMAADKVIFPGQGEAGYTMQYLQKNGLDEVIKGLRQPVLGICIGMQLMCKYSEESDTPCLGIFDSTVKRFIAKEKGYKIPHMGWNDLNNLKGEFMTSQLENEYVYFVHSYYVPLSAHTIAETDYIQPFSAALQKDNFYAVQFHPEKSGSIGERILSNFLNI